MDAGICGPIHQTSAILSSSLIPFLISLSHTASFHSAFLDSVHCCHFGTRQLGKYRCWQWCHMSGAQNLATFHRVSINFSVNCGSRCQQFGTMWPCCAANIATVAFWIQPAMSLQQAKMCNRSLLSAMCPKNNVFVNQIGFRLHIPLWLCCAHPWQDVSSRAEIGCAVRPVYWEN